MQEKKEETERSQSIAQVQCERKDPRCLTQFGRRTSVSHDVPTEDRSTGMDEQETSPGNQVMDDSARQAGLAKGSQVPEWSWMVLDEHDLGLADDCQRSTAVSGLSDMFSSKWESHQVANEETRLPRIFCVSLLG